MSAIRSSVLSAVLLASVGAGQAFAQGAEFSLGGGVTLPLGDFDDVAKLVKARADTIDICLKRGKLGSASYRRIELQEL